jgi:hypothetical protein
MTAPATTLIDKASTLALKKKAKMQCAVPTGRSADPVKAMSAVWPAAPITQAKWKKSP